MNVTRVFFYVSSVFPFSSYVKLFEILLTAMKRRYILIFVLKYLHESPFTTTFSNKVSFICEILNSSEETRIFNSKNLFPSNSHWRMNEHIDPLSLKSSETSIQFHLILETLKFDLHTKFRTRLSVARNKLSHNRTCNQRIVAWIIPSRFSIPVRVIDPKWKV